MIKDGDVFIEISKVKEIDARTAIFTMWSSEDRDFWGLTVTEEDIPKIKQAIEILEQSLKRALIMQTTRYGDIIDYTVNNLGMDRDMARRLIEKTLANFETIEPLMAEAKKKRLVMAYVRVLAEEIKREYKDE